jgi:hypothetical protein
MMPLACRHLAFIDADGAWTNWLESLRGTRAGPGAGAEAAPGAPASGSAAVEVTGCLDGPRGRAGRPGIPPGLRAARPARVPPLPRRLHPRPAAARAA